MRKVRISKDLIAVSGASARLRIWLTGMLLIAAGGGGIGCWAFTGHGAGESQERFGFTTRTFRDSSGTDHRYVVFHPHVPAPESGFPVILFLNGRGENGDDGVRQLSNNFGEQIWEMKRKFPFLCVAVQCHACGSWLPDSPDTSRAMAILHSVLENDNVDPNRIFVTGPSAGGAGALALGAAFPETFAAVVPVSASTCLMPLESAVQSYVTSNTAIWCPYNGGDQFDVVDFNRRLRQKLIAAGQSPVFREFDRTGHNAWLPTYSDPALYEWLWQQSLARNRSARRRSPFALLLQPALTEWTPSRAGTWLLDDDGALHHRAESLSREPAKFWHEGAKGDFELHFDYRSETDADCVVILRGRDGTRQGSDTHEEAELRIIIRSGDRGSGGVLRGKEDGGEWLAVSNSLAQRAFHPHSWNDVRIQRTGDRLRVFVNGWETIELDDARTRGVEFGFRASDAAEEDQSWRDVRFRDHSQNNGDWAPEGRGR